MKKHGSKIPSSTENYEESETDESLSSSTSSEDDEEEEIEKVLADVTFEELQKARSNGTHAVFKKRGEDKKLKRANKNRPMEASSKKPVPAFRDVIQAPKKVIRDPRFESLCGTLDPDGFRNRYNFLYEKDLPAERQALKKEMRKRKDPEQKNEIEERISWVDKQLKSVQQKMLRQLNKDLHRKPLKVASDDETLPMCWHGKKPFRSIDEVKKYFKPLVLSFSNGGKVKSQFEIPPEAYLIISVSYIDQQGLRFNLPLIFIYSHQPSMASKYPVEVLRNALSQTLVYYYPLAGRIKEGDGHKLMVDCTAEGVMFIEVEADVTLNQFGDSLHPPFPCFQELLYDVSGSELTMDHPIRLIQVTRLKCGGFIIAISWNHIMGDAAGLKQFMNAWAEMARGAHQPSIQPVWHREILMARDPPCITCNHREYEQILPSNTIKDDDTTAAIVHQSFCFRPSDIAAIRLLVPFQCSTFDLIAACFWYCRAKALQLDPKGDVRLMCLTNAR